MLSLHFWKKGEQMGAGIIVKVNCRDTIHDIFVVTLSPVKGIYVVNEFHRTKKD